MSLEVRLEPEGVGASGLWTVELALAFVHHLDVLFPHAFARERRAANGTCERF